MSLVKCERCGFVKVEWGPCETCAKDFGLGPIMPDVGLDQYSRIVDGVARDEIDGVGVGQRELHQLTTEESNLTHRPNGGYMHIGTTKCMRCGERFYYVVNALQPIPEYTRTHFDRVMSIGFGRMVAAAPPCKGVTA